MDCWEVRDVRGRNGNGEGFEEEKIWMEKWRK